MLRKWRQKYSPIATYRNLAKCFYDAGKPEMVEVICKALGAPSDSVVGQSVGLQGEWEVELLIPACARVSGKLNF